MESDSTYKKISSIFEDINDIKEIKDDPALDFKDNIGAAIGVIDPHSLNIRDLQSAIPKAKKIINELEYISLIGGYDYSKINSTYKSMESMLIDDMHSHDYFLTFSKILYFLHILNKRYSNNKRGKRLPMTLEEAKLLNLRFNSNLEQQHYTSLFNNTIDNNGFLWEEDKYLDKINDFLKNPPTYTPDDEETITDKKSIKVKKTTNKKTESSKKLIIIN